MMSYGAQRITNTLLGASAGEDHIMTLAVPPDMQPLTPSFSDADIDTGTSEAGLARYHLAGTTALGRVIDIIPVVIDRRERPTSG